MKIVENFVTKNPCYRAARKITVKGLMLHSIGTPQPKAEVLVKNFDRTNAPTCVHGFIDGYTGTTYQTLPWNFRAWHCGGSGNDSYIGIEMCEPATITYTGGSTFVDNDYKESRKVVWTTYQAAVELFAYLCKLYGLNPMKDILSHAEGHKKGIASNHGDPEHVWKKYGLTMDGFRADVKKTMEGEDVTKPTKQKLIVDGKEVKAECVNIDGYNFYKLRDLCPHMGYNVGNNGKVPVIWKNE